MSLPIPEVIATLRDLKVPADVIIKVENELEAKEAEKAEAAAATPKAKNQFVTILLDPENKLKGLGDFVSIVAQIPESEDVATVTDRIFKAAYAQNVGGKRKKWNINKLGDIGLIKRKFLKDQKIAIKSGREPVRVIVSDGQIPTG